MDTSMSSSGVGQGLESAIAQVEQASGPCDPELLSEAESRVEVRVQQRNDAYDKTVWLFMFVSVLDPDLSLVASLGFGNYAEPHHSCKPLSNHHPLILFLTLHPKWKYKQWAMALLVRLLRKDAPTTAAIAQTIVENVVSDHPTTREYAQRRIDFFRFLQRLYFTHNVPYSALVQLLRSVKARTFSKSAEDLWLNAGKNPLRAELHAPDFASYLTASLQPLTSDTYVALIFGGLISLNLFHSSILIDAVREDALIWKPVLAGYKLPPENESAFAWEPSSREALAAISTSVDANWFSRLASLWSQEGNRSSTSTDLRIENLWLIKILCEDISLSL
jgi:hypothetical protein